MLEDLDERGVALAVNLQELDLREPHALDRSRLVEIIGAAPVVLPQDRPVLAGDDGLELEHVPDKDHLHPSEGGGAAPHVPEGPVHRVDDVAPHHRHLVDDDRVDMPNEGNLVPVQDTDIPGAEHPQRQPEERMDGLPARVHRRNTRRRDDDEALVDGLLDHLEEGGLARSRAAGEEEGVVGLRDHVEGELLLVVGAVELCFHFFSVYS